MTFSFLPNKWCFINYKWSLPLAVLMFAQILFVSPVFSHNPLQALTIFNNYNGFTALWRTLLFASLSSILEVASGFVLAVLTYGARNFLVVRGMPFLMLPTLVGSVAFSFIFHLSLPLVQSVRERSIPAVLVLLITMEVFQYGGLFAYIFWMRLQSISKERILFAQTSHFSLSECISHIYWPHSKNLAIVLLLFGLMLSLNEHSKTEILLKSSAETHTEMTTHWQVKIFNITQQQDIKHAFDVIQPISEVITILAILLSFAMIVLVLSGSKLMSKSCVSKLWDKIGFNKAGMLGSFIIAVYLALCLYGIIVILCYVSKPSTGLPNLIIESFSFMIVGGVFASLAAIVVAITARMYFPAGLSHFHLKSLILIILLLSPRSIPAISVGFCSNYWYHSILMGSSYGYRTLLLCGQILIIIPFLLAFAISMHFDVRVSTVTFLRNCCSSFTESTKSAFYPRFKGNYVLIVIFACLFLWNEETISRSASAYVTTVGNSLYGKTTGRGTNICDAIWLILPSLTVAFTSIFLWQKNLRQQLNGK